MAFNINNLDLIVNFHFLGNLDGRVWEYDAGSDDLSDIDAGSGGTYFSTIDAAYKLRGGNLIQVTANDGLALYGVRTANLTVDGGVVIEGNVSVRRIANVTDFNVNLAN